MRYLLLSAVLSLAVPAQAITMDTPNTWTTQQGTLRGEVQQQLPGQLKIDGKTYEFTLTSARVFDRDGRQLSGARLAPGTQVVFTLAAGGSRRIANLWIV
jgi:hypothetical protein